MEKKVIKNINLSVFSGFFFYVEIGNVFDWVGKSEVLLVGVCLG